MEMTKLTKHWRKHRGFDDLTIPTSVQSTSFEDSRPLDSQEQEDLVRSLDKEQTKQAYFWRRVFAFILMCYGAFLVWTIFQQGSSPWELRYNAYFMEEMNSVTLIAADWIAVTVSIMAMIGVLRSSERNKLWFICSSILGLLIAVFWLYYMLRLPKFRWDVIWLPLGPLSSVALCFYVDRLLKESSEEIRKLRSYMYAYKAS